MHAVVLQRNPTTTYSAVPVNSAAPWGLTKETTRSSRHAARGRVSNNGLWLVVGDEVEWPSGRKDAVAEKVESRASVHLSHDPLDAGVDASGAAVAAGQGDSTAHSGPVDLETVRELRGCGRSTAQASAIHSVSFTSLSSAGVSSAAKLCTRLASAVISGAGCGDSLEQDRVLRAEVPRFCEQQAAGVTGGHDRGGRLRRGPGRGRGPAGWHRRCGPVCESPRGPVGEPRCI